MLSVSPFKSAAMGSSYFDEDSYYDIENESSQWYGKGAKELGLEGTIKKDDFGMVLDGFAPDETALVSNAGKKDKRIPEIRDENGKVIKKATTEIGRRSYIDMTFSAPKSVSLLKYVDPRIEKAHNRALERALKEVENNYAHTRKSVDGTVQTVSADNLIMARINHHESRELDPQLHSHIVLMNLTKGEDGKWRSIEPGEIYKNQMYIGQVYRNELAKEMQQLGYQVEVTDRRKGFYEIQGVDQDLRDEFSTRRKQIEEHLEKHADYYKLQPTSNAKMYEQVALDSRRSKKDETVTIVRASVIERLEKHIPTFEALKELSLEHKTAPKRTKNTAKECIAMALEEVTDKQSGFRKEEIINFAMKAGLGEHTVADLLTAFESQEDIKELGTQAQFAGRTQSSETTFYTTDDILKTESGVIEWAKKWRGKSTIRVSEEKVKTHLEGLAKLPKPIILTRGQKETLEMICTTKDTLSLVQGNAGTGKSFACKQVKVVMESSGYTVRGFAPTGKASVSLAEAGLDAKTVDSFLESAALGKTGLGRKEVWIVDESGMLGARKMEQFLKEATKHEAKVVLIGDKNQFQSVNQGKIFADLQELAGITKSEILEVQRQKTEHAKEIVKAIQEKDFDKVFSVLDEQKSLIEVPGRGDRLKQIADEYLQDRQSGVDTMVLSSTNKDKDELNKEIRGRLEKSGEIESGKTYITHQKAGLDAVTRKFADSYKEGQAVVFRKEMGGIKKGSKGKIVGCNGDKNELQIEFWDKESSSHKEVSLNCKKQSRKIEVYNPVEKKFGKGDRIIFQNNDKNVNVSNGEIGTIKGIDKNGIAVVGIGNEKKPKEYREVELNLNGTGKKGYQFCDHAYSITSHKSQGATVDKVIINSEASTHKSSFNEFYVQATRERRDISVYTNDRELLKTQVQVEQNKISTRGDFGVKAAWKKHGEAVVDFSKYEKAMADNRKDLEEGRERIPSNQSRENDRKDDIKVAIDKSHEESQVVAAGIATPVPVPPVSNATEIYNVINEKYSFKLPPMTVAAIEKGISEKTIKPERALKIIEATIEESRAKGYTWKNSTSPDSLAIYSKENKALTEGDIIIKLSSEATPQQPQYEAFCIIYSSKSKYLGSDSDLDFLKFRVEHYSISLAVQTEIQKAIEPSVSENNKPAPEKDSGMDL